MYISELRAMDNKKLFDTIEDQRERLFNLRFQKESGQMEDVNLLRYAKRDLSRMLTVRNERKLAAMVLEEEDNG
jgi:large subunit ribosomal protein L29